MGEFSSAWNFALLASSLEQQEGKSMMTNLRRCVRRSAKLSIESLESRQLLAANPIVTSTDGSITIGADFSSPEVHSFESSDLYSDITIESGLPIASGYARATEPEISLSGTANASNTEVLVGGRVANWSAADGTWSIDWTLNPGINRLIVQAFDTDGNETDRSYTDIWLDTSEVATPPISIPFGSNWSYLDDGSDQGTQWRTAVPGPTWNTGSGQLGYGDGDESTTVERGPSNDAFTTTYFQHRFEIPAGQAASYDQISIDLLRDDGAAVYINGTEVVRTDNLPGTLGDDLIRYDTWADVTGTKENLRSTFEVPEELVAGLLRDGENIIAVEVHQHDAESSDMSFDLGLVASVSAELGFTNVSGRLPDGTTTWSASEGPYFISSDVYVPLAGTLIIEPGTTVYFGNDQSLDVGGRLIAAGTPSDLIRFTRVPGSNTLSDGIQFNGTMQNNRITNAVVEWGGSRNNGLIGLVESKLTLDHVTLDHAERRRIRTIDSALTVRNSVFTDIFAPDAPPSTDNVSEHIWGRNVPDGEAFIVENNIFGTTKGHNDAIDFDAGTRPAAVPQILNNTFLGVGDDAMDFEGDIHIEGNLVMNVIKDEWNTGSGNANALSAGDGHHYFLARNIFYNVDQVAQVKQNSFLTFVNNTVVSTIVSATYYQRPSGGEFGRGGYLDSNIFVDTPRVLDDYNDETDLTLNRSAFSSDETSFGIGNIAGDVMLTDPTSFDFNLLPGSPAIGAGFGGVDLGALVPAGATISGVPSGTTQATTATLTVGGPDLFAYRYRFDGGDWSEVVAVENPGTKDQIVPPINLTDLSPGSHFVEVVKQNSAAVWQSEANATRSPSWTVGEVDIAAVIDALCGQTLVDFPDLQYDFDGDGDVSETDLSFYVEQTLGTAIGDANLDGKVDAVDLNRVGLHWQQSGTLGWAQGNFNCDFAIDAADLNKVGLNWQFGAEALAETGPLASTTRAPKAALALQAPVDQVSPITVRSIDAAPDSSSPNSSHELQRPQTRSRASSQARRTLLHSPSQQSTDEWFARLGSQLEQSWQGAS